MTSSKILFYQSTNLLKCSQKVPSSKLNAFHTQVMQYINENKDDKKNADRTVPCPQDVTEQ